MIADADDSSKGEAPVPSPTEPIIPKVPLAADLLFANAPEKKLYWDRSHYDSPASQMKALANSSTLYVGNLAFRTRSHNIGAHFRQLGPVRQIHMGLDRFRKTPCGFCFVQYVRREDALLAVAYLSGTKLDGKVIRVELDAGFQPGRQYGRGVSGGQVRDDRRMAKDPARRNNRHKPTWTPPSQVQAQNNQSKEGDTSANIGNSGGGGYYGPSRDEDSKKRSREDDNDGVMEQSNKRYRDED